MRKIKPYTYGLKDKRRPVWRREAPKSGARFFGTLRITAAIICALFSLTFMITMCMNIVNYGNIFGLSFCLTVILLVILYPAAKNVDLLKNIFRFIGALMAAFALYSAVVSGFMISGMFNPPPKSVVTGAGDGEPVYSMVVLGCKTMDGKPSAMLKCRLDKAIEYEKSHPDCVIILCGGKGEDEIEPEAVSMRRYLVENGIEPSKLYVEAKSIDTTENINNAKLIIDKKELPRKIVIISEFYHVYRAQRLARLQKLENYAVWSVVPDIGLVAMPTYWVRELLAVSRDYAVSLFS